MAEVKITIKNLADIKAAFNMAPRLMVRELNKAIHLSVATIGRRSRQNTPVDTGRLRASTHERFAPLRGEVGTHTNYDLFVHEGTRFMRARPYLRRAVESSDQEIQGNFTTAVENVLHEVGKRT